MGGREYGALFSIIIYEGEWEGTGSDLGTHHTVNTVSSLDD